MNRVLPPAGKKYECTSKVCSRRGKTQKKIRETDCTTGSSRKTWQLGIDLVLRSQVQTHGACITLWREGYALQGKTIAQQLFTSIHNIPPHLSTFASDWPCIYSKPGCFVSFLPWVILFLSPYFYTKVALTKTVSFSVAGEGSTSISAVRS